LEEKGGATRKEVKVSNIKKSNLVNRRRL